MAHKLRMTDMESKTQEQVLVTQGQSYLFEAIFIDVDFACAVINASPVVFGGTE